MIVTKVKKIISNVQNGPRGLIGRSVVNPVVEDYNHVIVTVIRMALLLKVAVQGTPLLEDVVMFIAVRFGQIGLLGLTGLSHVEI